MDEALHLPYAVYGTLRSGCGNDRLWKWRGESVGLGWVYNYRLVTNGGFPYALPSRSGSTVVEIVSVLPEHAVAVRESLDSLEGYPMFYDRQIVMVETGESPTRCWMYIPVAPETYEHLAPVPDNDWMRMFDEAEEWVS